MKKCYVLLLTTLVCSIIPSYTYAQILFGPKVGYQTSWIRYAPLYDGSDYTEGLMFSPQLGAIYGFSVSKALSFYSELYYTQRAKREATTDVTTLLRRHSAKYHFLEVPLMLRVERRLGKSKEAPFIYANAGPQVSLWLAGSGELQSLETFGSTNWRRTEYKVGFSNNQSQEGGIYAENANRLQFGLSAGSGVMIPMNKRGQILQLDFRYSYSSTFMGSDLDLEIADTGVEENFSFGHSFISASVAYAFYIDIWGLRKGKSVRRK